MNYTLIFYMNNNVEPINISDIIFTSNEEYTIFIKKLTNDMISNSIFLLEFNNNTYLIDSKQIVYIKISSSNNIMNNDKNFDEEIKDEE